MSLTDTETRGTEAYEALKHALISGQFVPGQKLKLRTLAEALGMSITPVREAIHRLTAERALEASANRSVRVPPMTRAKLFELREIRLTVEGLAVEKAAQEATAEELQRLRQLALELMAARQRGDVSADIAKLAEFQFTLYRTAHMPLLIPVIESLWLQTGSCLRLLYPSYINSIKHDWRGEIIKALAAHDPQAARKALESDIGPALSYIAGLAGPDGVIQFDERDDTQARHPRQPRETAGT